ncbi:LPD38 domain-containing protein [Dokdonella ginsengisoli]|uniref:LPD38 domain-containing protein n=1 Tax=Dokdonella ginsengisoli TaxID=363846 RepID=A0ABV9QQY8_9GAMM
MADNPFDQFDNTALSGTDNPFDAFDASHPDFSNVDAGADSTAPYRLGVSGWLERAGRSAASRSIDLAALLQQGTPSGMAEAISAPFTGIPSTADQARQAARDIAPEAVAKDNYAARSADFAGAVVPDLAAIVASGGSAGVGVVGRMLAGARAMTLPAAENARQRYEQGVAAGQNRIDALGGAAVTGATTLASGALPASVGASLPVRLASGAAIGAGAAEAQRQIENAVSPESLQREFDPFDTAAGAIFGGAIGGMHGAGPAPRTDGHVDVLAGKPSRRDFAPDRVELRETTDTANLFDQFDPRTAKPIDVPPPEAIPAPAAAGESVIAARAAFDAALGDIADFGEARSLAERIAEQHGIAADEVLPLPDWLAAPKEGVAAADEALPPRPFGETSATNLPPPPVVDDALAELQRPGTEAEPLAIPRRSLMDEPAAEPIATANTGDVPAREGTEASPLDSHAQRIPGEDASVGQPLDALIDQAVSSGISFRAIAEATRSTDDAVAARAVRDLLAEGNGSDHPTATTDLARVDRNGEAGSGSPVRADGLVAEGSGESGGAGSAPSRLDPSRTEFGSVEGAGLGSAEARLPNRIASAAREWRERGTTSPFFNKFFRGSKVIDDAGAPRIVHHGTGAEFTVFRDEHSGNATAHATSALGHFFTTNREVAGRYAENAAEGRPADARIVDAYLAIRRPYRMPLDEAQAIRSADEARALRAKLERRGFDGIELPEAKSWIAFRPEQVKSVDNRGTFDATDPDIRFARAARDDSAPTLRDEQVHELASRILGVNASNRVVVTPWDSLPAEIRKAAEEQGAAAEDVRAVHWRGKTYLVGDRLRSVGDVAEAIYHEHFTHFGLRAKYGSALGAKLGEILHRVGGLEGVRQLARDQGIDLSDYEAGVLGNSKIAARDQRLILMEELLAHMSRTTGTLHRTLQEWVGALRDWLRRNGFAELSRYGATDLAHVLREARQAALSADAPESKSRPMFQRTSRAAGDREALAPVAKRRDLDPAQQAALEKIGARPESLSAKFRSLSSRWHEKAVQGLVDQFAPIKDLDSVAYQQARLSRGVDGAVEASFLHGPVKLTDGALDVTSDGKGLRGVLSELAGEHDLFFAWVAGNRAERLAREGRERLFTEADITALKRLNQGRLPDGRSRAGAYARALVEFNRYQKAILDVAEEAGLISAASREKWAQEFYVPFRRTDLGESGSLDPADLTPPLVKKGTEEPIEALKGGTQPLGDLLANTLENWNRLLVSSMRNMAATKALAAAAKVGEARRVEEPSKTSLRVRIDGKAEHYEVSDPLLVDALTMLHFNGWQSPALRVASRFKRALSFGVTVSPAFRIRNLLRDTLTALAVSDHTGTNPIRNLVDGWAATKPGSETDIRLLAGGGKVRFGSLTDGDHAAAAKRLIASGVDESRILDSSAKIKKALREAWHSYQELGDRGESVNRAAIYERARAAGKSHLEASYEARDLLDFTMAGKWAAVRLLAQTVPFANARAQGLYRLGRGAKASPQRFAAITGAVALASVALYLAQREDEDYRALPDYVRNAYWAIKLGDKFLYLPKPFEIGALGTVAERSVELAVARDDYRARDFANSLQELVVSQLAMNPIPQAVRPALEVAFNYDSFRGRPIDSQGQERLPPENRYTSRSSAAAVQLGKLTNSSPNMIEHLVGGYLGWLGVQALNVADVMARPFTDLPPNPGRDPARLRNWPVLGDFVKEARGGSSKYVERLYAMQRELEQVYAARREAARAGDDVAAEALAPKLDKLGLYRGGAKALARNRAEQRQVEQDRALTPAERRARLDELAMERNRIAADVDREARMEP